MERPAADERMAVLESRLLPGRASMIDWALVLGSGEGTLELLRAVTKVETAGRARGTMVGRRRAAPATALGSALAPAFLSRQLRARGSFRLTDSISRQAGRHCGMWDTRSVDGLTLIGAVSAKCELRF